MPKNNELSSKDLEKKIDLLIKRFEEQKGIIDSYVKREREWKKDKVLHRKEISRLERDLKKVTNCLLYTSPSPRDRYISRMPSSA